MQINRQAKIELKNLSLTTQIGTYAPEQPKPDKHLLDLTLFIDSALVLIERDAMECVFDYDPLIVTIERLAKDGHYETQERLITRIVFACAAYPQIESLEICLRKSPVSNGSGSLGVRLTLDRAALNAMR